PRRQEGGLGRPADEAHGQLHGADALPRLRREEALDPAVLERVERDGREPSADGQRAPGRRQRPVERVELAVDRDPNRLKGSLRRVTAPEAIGGRDGGADGLDELAGAAEGPAGGDLSRDRARVALLT